MAFPCSWDGFVKGMTAFVIALFVILTVMFINIGFLEERFLLGVAVFNAITGMAIIGGTYRYSPRLYTVSSEYIIVKRSGPDVIIDISHVRNVRKGSKDDLAKSIRVLGNGGIFGYVGIFRSAKLKQFKAYMTRKDRTVIIEMTDNTTYVLSPDETDKFIDKVKSFQEENLPQR